MVGQASLAHVAAAVVVAIEILKVGDAVVVTVERASIVDAIVIGVHAAGLVDIERIVDAVKIGIAVGGAAFDGVVDAVVIAVRIDHVGDAVPVAVAGCEGVVYAVAIGVVAACEVDIQRIIDAVQIAVVARQRRQVGGFDGIGHTVVVGVGVEVVGGAIVVAVLRFECVVDAVEVDIAAAGGVGVDGVVDAVDIGVTAAERWQGALFDAVGNAIVIGVAVLKVGQTVQIGVGVALDDVGNAVVVSVAVQVVGQAVAVGIGGLEGVVDAVAVGVDAAGEVHINGVVDAIAVTVVAGQRRQVGVFVHIRDAVVVRIGVQVVGNAVVVTVAVALRDVRNAVVVGVQVDGGGEADRGDVARAIVDGGGEGVRALAERRAWGACPAVVGCRG